VAVGEPCDRPVTIIMVVRHADRAGKADSLTAAGVERAQALVNVAKHARVTAIYHSDTNRTRDTAAPLATALGIKPEVYPAKEVEALVQRILRDRAGATVLVVGHSNTVPMIIAAAGGPPMDEIAENEFDGLFIVQADPCHRAGSRLIELQYGAPSP
jgi:broad specificity phosphatase PhoE